MQAMAILINEQFTVLTASAESVTPEHELAAWKFVWISRIYYLISIVLVFSLVV